MKVKLPHVPYIARKIAIDMLNSGFIKFDAGIEAVSEVASEILKDDVLKERAIDEKVRGILEEKEDDMDMYGVDRRDLFWMVKRRLADESEFVLNYQERYGAISHAILEMAWKKGYIDYKVSENKAKNIIYQSIKSYLKNYEKIEDIVYEKISKLARKLDEGSVEYDLVFEKLYEEELKKKGLI